MRAARQRARRTKRTGEDQVERKRKSASSYPNRAQCPLQDKRDGNMQDAEPDGVNTAIDTPRAGEDAQGSGGAKTAGHWELVPNSGEGERRR